MIFKLYESLFMYYTILLSKYDNFDIKVHWNSSSKNSDADILHNLRRFMQKPNISCYL